MTKLTVRSAEELMKDNMLVKHYAGSHAYGTSLPTSDVDFRGIFCADPVNILTSFFPIREKNDEDEEDTKFFELSHFMNLCIDCNPNIIETLWVHRDDMVYTTEAYELLRHHKHNLLSSKLAFTFSGYAMSQLKRIKGHNKWINNPQPEEPPRQTDFLSLVQNFQTDKKFFKVHNQIMSHRQGHRFIPYGDNIYGVYQIKGYNLFDDNYLLNTTYEDEGNRHLLGVPLFIVKFNKKEYIASKENHKKYWTWKKNRNKDRAKLEEKFGYDAKHAMHLVRLMRMGIEALRDGEIIVKRPDADELLSIRNGAMTYEELLEYAEHMDNEVRNVWYKKTELPKKPDIKLAAKLVMEVQKSIWGNITEL